MQDVVMRVCSILWCTVQQRSAMRVRECGRVEKKKENPTWRPLGWMVDGRSWLEPQVKVLQAGKNTLIFSWQSMAFESNGFFLFFFLWFRSTTPPNYSKQQDNELTRIELVTLACPFAGDCRDRSGDSFCRRKGSEHFYAHKHLLPYTCISYLAGHGLGAVTGYNLESDASPHLPLCVGAGWVNNFSVIINTYWQK